jgi:hypothetical protein
VLGVGLIVAVGEDVGSKGSGVFEGTTADGATVSVAGAGGV